MKEKEFKHGKDGKKPQAYPPEIRQQAIELFNSCVEEYGTKKYAAQHVADLLGIGSFTSVLKWVAQDERDSGRRAGATTEDLEEVRKLRRENAELRRANAILKAASAFFAAELDRPLNK
jgi:transposase